MFINKTLRLYNSKTRTAVNVEISVFLICVEAIIYLLLFNLYDGTFKPWIYHVLFFCEFANLCLRYFIFEPSLKLR